MQVRSGEDERSDFSSTVLIQLADEPVDHKVQAFLHDERVFVPHTNRNQGCDVSGCAVVIFFTFFQS